VGVEGVEFPWIRSATLLSHHPTSLMPTSARTVAIDRVSSSGGRANVIREDGDGEIGVGVEPRGGEEMG